VPDHPSCMICTRNPKVKDQWHPNDETADKIVKHYINQMRWQSTNTISAIAIAKHSGVQLFLIEESITRLMKEGVLKSEQTVVIVGVSKDAE